MPDNDPQRELLDAFTAAVDRARAGLSFDDDLPGMWTHADFEGGPDYEWEAQRLARLETLREQQAQVGALNPELGPNPDCVNTRAGVPHGSHNLAGPGGNKPGARCGGVPAPEIAGVRDGKLTMPDRWDGDDG